MGIAEIVPGVSAGTIAFVSGIYEEFISSLNNINIRTVQVLRKDGFLSFWKALNGNFLATLFVGMLASILLFTKLVRWLLENEPLLVWSFFFGLVLASVLLVAKDIQKWNVTIIILLIGGAVIAYFLTTLPPSSNSGSLPFLFFAGALAVCAMILPGISGSYIMVLLGAYKTIIDALDEKDFKILLTVGLGIVFGILSFAKVLKWMFEHYKNITLAILTGFILGSLNKIWPWKKILETKVIGKKEILIEENISPFAFEGDSQLMYAVMAAIVGFSLIFILERTASKK